MKQKRRLSFWMVFATAALTAFTFASKSDRKYPVYDTKPEGTALVITGAAAKIAQEAALLESLYKRGELNDVVFISGASSGALNAVMLNAILEKKLTWKEYREIFANINNDRVFKINGKGLPASNEPLRELLTEVVEKRLGYKTLADLPYPTAISVVSLRPSPFSEGTYRFCNRKINAESDSSLNLVDVLMASTAYPLVFPPTRIDGLKTIPNIPYYDGGIGDDRVPFQALLDFEKYRGKPVKRVIIISRKRDDDMTLADELRPFGFEISPKLKGNFSPDMLTSFGFWRRLEYLKKRYPETALKTWVFVPDYDYSFPMFDFNNLSYQYELTYQWAQSHSPIKLDEFLKKKPRLLKR
ncbi:patatin-like phospholipase family protein [Tenuifilum thalassicum]|uniref:Patatin-like phospholipase family protein n=1 Tax=Tenuifilum thalassicum TaxID=2590900 RepID=A0A7D3XEI4_9BACT|nr:patatin-like phospholipase family protein [Tenuifilum thalassicum]QKG78897.1 patatin-like phospholipase family protein [Tenuifilum thalassicum]